MPSNAFTQVKKQLLEDFNLHTILSLPAGVFLPYSGVKTNVIFFERTGGTSDVWFYECEPEQKLTKNKPITEDYHLSAKNPAKQKEVKHQTPKDILAQQRTKEKTVSGLLDEIQKMMGCK